MGEPVLERVEGGTAVLTLNRPDARNALNRALVDDLKRRLRRLDSDPAIKAIVITGADPVFCTGADLKEIAPVGVEAAFARAEASMELHRLLPRLRKPVIAAVNGHALAGGCGLALACDLVVAADTAQFGYPETPRGLVAALVMVNLTRLVGRRTALELLLTGRRTTADRARELGMINEVVGKAELMARALALAAEIGGHPTTAVSFTKSLFYEVAELPFDSALARARDVNLRMRMTDAGMRGAAAFFEKDGKGK